MRGNKSNGGRSILPWTGRQRTEWYFLQLRVSCGCDATMMYGRYSLPSVFCRGVSPGEGPGGGGIPRIWHHERSSLCFRILDRLRVIKLKACETASRATLFPPVALRRGQSTSTSKAFTCRKSSSLASMKFPKAGLVLDSQYLDRSIASSHFALACVDPLVSGCGHRARRRS